MTVPDAMAAMVVPQPITAIATWASLAICVAGLAWCVRHLVRTGEPMPLFLLVGGAIASVLEPLYDVIALSWHPVIGQWTAFHLFERDIPWLMPVGWCWNVGGSGALLWLCFRNGRITARNIWAWFAAAVAMNMAFEVPGTALGIYTYYGRQPLPLTAGSYSLAIAFGNGAAALTIGLLAWRLSPLFRSSVSAWTLGWFITPFRVLDRLRPRLDARDDGGERHELAGVVHPGHGPDLHGPVAVADRCLREDHGERLEHRGCASRRCGAIAMAQSPTCMRLHRS